MKPGNQLIKHGANSRRCVFMHLQDEDALFDRQNLITNVNGVFIILLFKYPKEAKIWQRDYSHQNQ